MNHSILTIIIPLIAATLTAASCAGETRIIDRDGPEFLFTAYCGERIVFQFNEPVSKLECRFDNGSFFLVTNKFPTSNIFIHDSYFSAKPEKLTLLAHDTSHNSTSVTITTPLVNRDPAGFSIEEVRLRYTKKKQQFIKVRTIKGGNTLGYSIVIFYKNKKQIIRLAKGRVIKGKSYYLVIERDKNEDELISTVLLHSSREKVIFKNRLSQSLSCIILYNHKNQIDDYLLYYNSKNKSLEEYKASSYYKMLISLIYQTLENPVWFDINGTTSKRTIVKKEGRFILNPG